MKLSALLCSALLCSALSIRSQAAVVELPDNCKGDFIKKSSQSEEIIIAKLIKKIDHRIGEYQVKIVFKGNLLPGEKIILVEDGLRSLIAVKQLDILQGNILAGATAVPKENWGLLKSEKIKDAKSTVYSIGLCTGLEPITPSTNDALKNLIDDKLQ